MDMDAVITHRSMCLFFPLSQEYRGFFSEPPPLFLERFFPKNVPHLLILSSFHIFEKVSRDN